jgi:hypothetical protein
MKPFERKSKDVTVKRAAEVVRSARQAVKSTAKRTTARKPTAKRTRKAKRAA